MLRAGPEALVLLGALLSGPFGPASKYHVLLASGCHSVPLGMREGRIAIQWLPEPERTGQVAVQLSPMGNFPAQPRGRAGGLGARFESGSSPGRGRRVPELSQGD